MNKRYPHLKGKLPAPGEKRGNINGLIFWWWER
jgi:hypothetical protein